MVTSNKLPDKKVVKMSEHSAGVVVPQRTLLGEVNEHITCPLCRGYYIDATTIVECLHSFCRSCIIKHLKVKSYCPICEMMINSAKPNIKLDKALQDIVYKLVPGLFQKEMERRQQFYASRPGPAASATPEQRGEDTERVIFSPEDVISFSLEYSDATDTDSISSKSSDSNEPQPSTGISRRYLQCPAVVNISHLKKFLSMKFDIDSTQFAIDILYKRVPLPDYYTLMDIAYIYNWKRNEPMRFFYQIIDYIAIRNRLFDINRKSLHFTDRKSSPASTEDTNISSPAIHLNDHISEASSGTDSPMPGESFTEQTTDNNNIENVLEPSKNPHILENNLSLNKSDDDVEKSQFLNSFELTAKSNCVGIKTSPNKSSTSTEELTSTDPIAKGQFNVYKTEDKQLKRKIQTTSTPELKKLKIELEKAKVPNYVNNLPSLGKPSASNSVHKVDSVVKQKESEVLCKTPKIPELTDSSTTQATIVKEMKTQQTLAVKQQVDTPGIKRPTVASQNSVSSKRKPNEVIQLQPPPPSVLQKPLSLHKHLPPKLDIQPSLAVSEAQKPVVKKIPDLKPTVHVTQQAAQHKLPSVNKIRMDLLANNSDPTIDRSKILPQVKCTLGVPNPGQTSGDPLKSLFDSCKLNIPSSLSITLTDQKLESRGINDSINSDSKKNILNKNLSTATGTSSHKAPSPPVHNYIEILKLPDTDTKKVGKIEGNSESKLNSQNKTDVPASQTKPNKASETSAKGPVPNLKPIADTKLGKQAGNFSAPITFQQTFEQQLQTLQSDKKSKVSKNKAQVPKLVPATPKSLSNVNKPNNISQPKPNTSSSCSSTENKSSTALDLSTAHSIQSHLSSQQTFDKTLETMQSIANLAKKQNLPSKGLPLNMTQSISSVNLNRPSLTGVSSLRIPSTTSLGSLKLDKQSASGPQSQSDSNRQDLPKSNQIKSTNSGNSAMSTSSYIQSHLSLSPTQPSPRSQTRSPSSSPKLVIAEEKQTTTDTSINQSNQISSTQLSNINIPKSESPKISPGPSKSNLKPVSKPTPPGKMAGIWQPVPPNLKSNSPMNAPPDYYSRQYLPKPMDINSANIWFRAQRQFDIIKSMSNMTHQTQNDFVNKDK